MRTKEDANDYRYFPDPDLAPIITSDEKLKKLTDSIPELPDVRKKLYVEKYSLTPYDAELITNEMEIADYFEKASKCTSCHKILANLIISDIMKLLDADSYSIKISPEHLASIAEMLGTSEINSSVGKKVIKALWENDTDPVKYVKDNDLNQINDRDTLLKAVLSAIESNPKSVADYKKGKTAAAKAIMGQVMAKTQGRGNPVLIGEILDEELKKL